MMLARHLRGRPVTVMTASLAVVDVLRDDEQVELVVLGGALRRPYLSLVGVLTQDALAQVRADRAFLGASGVRADGQVLDTTGVEVPVKRALIAAADQVVLLADRHKLPGSGSLRVCALKDIDVLVTNDGADPATLDACAAAGVEVLRLVKLAILGGGGFRVPLVYGALLRDTSAQPGRRRRRCTTWTRAASPRSATCWPRWAPGASRRRGVRATTDLDTALARRRLRLLRDPGRRPGRPHRPTSGSRSTWACSARRRPARAAWRTGCAPCRSPSRSPSGSGQLAPDAWVINFTNPAGMITEAMQRVLGDARRRHLRLADRAGPPGRPRPRARPGPDVAGLRGAQPPGLAARAARTTAGDVLPDLLADDALLAVIEEGRALRRRLDPHASAPCRTSTSTTTTSPATRSPPIRGSAQTRGEFLLDQQRGFYDAVAADPAHGPGRVGPGAARARRQLHEGGARAEDEERDPADVEGGGYEGVALAIMAAIARNERAAMILNVRNGTTPAGAAARGGGRGAVHGRRRRPAPAADRPARPARCSGWCSRSRRSSS